MRNAATEDADTTVYAEKYADIRQESDISILISIYCVEFVEFVEFIYYVVLKLAASDPSSTLNYYLAACLSHIVPRSATKSAACIVRVRQQSQKVAGPSRGQVLDPTRPGPTRPDPTRGSTRPTSNSAAMTVSHFLLTYCEKCI